MRDEGVQAPNRRRFCTVDEAEAAGIANRKTLYGAIERHEIEAVRIGRLIRITDPKILGLFPDAAAA